MDPTAVTYAPKRPRPLLAVLLIVVANLWVLPLALIAAVAARDLLEWYVSGGIFMHAITLVGLAQIGVGISLGIAHLQRPITPFAYLLLPAIVAIVGMAGTLVGAAQGAAFVAETSAPDRLYTWAMVLSLAESTRQYGLYVAAVGCLGAIAGCTVAAYVRRNRLEQRRTSLVAGGIAAALVLGATALAVLSAWQHGNLWVVAVQGSTLLCAVVLVGLAGRGIADLVRDRSDVRRVQALPLALAIAVALVGMTVTMQATLGLLAESSALKAVALAAPDRMTQMLTVNTSLGTALATQSPIFPLAALSAGILLLALAWPARRDALRGPRLLSAAVLVLVAATAAAHLLASRHLAAQTRAVARAAAPPIPDGIELPVSSSAARMSHLFPVVSVDGKAVTVDREIVADALGPTASAALAAQAARPAGRAAKPATREPDVAGAADNPRTQRLCDERLDVVCLALDAGTAGGRLRAILAWLASSGACRIHILTKRLPPPVDAAARRESDRKLREIGALGEVLLALGEETSIIRVALATSAPDPELPRLGLTLGVGAGHVKVEARGQRLDTIAAVFNAVVDRARLGERMESIKEAFAEERGLFVRIEDGATLQNVVDLLDAARESQGASTRTQLLFDEPALLAIE